MDLFKKQKSIEQVLAIMNDKGYQKEKVISELHSFLVEVEKRGFYEDASTLNVDNKLTLHIDITNKCNLSCVHCLRDAGNYKPNELSTLEWIKIIDTFSSQFKTSVCVSGGEPLLHPGVFDIVKRAKESHVFKSDERAKNEVRKLMAHVYTKKLKNLTKAEKNIKLTTCGYAETVVVSSVGDIFPCNVYEPKVKYGNVRVDDFAQIIKKIDEDRVALSVENIKKCRVCDLRYFCYGGCRLNNLYKRSDNYYVSSLSKETMCCNCDKEVPGGGIPEEPV